MSFVKEDVEVADISDLSSVEIDQLDEWENKFKYWKGYPVVGRIVQPPAAREFSLEELKAYNGAPTSENQPQNGESSTESPAPTGVSSPPIYVAIDGLVFDVSYGGSD